MPETTADSAHTAQLAEYGRYTAKGPIDIGGVRAFNQGDPVPVGHVKGGVVHKDDVDDNQSKETT